MPTYVYNDEKEKQIYFGGRTYEPGFPGGNTQDGPLGQEHNWTPQDTQSSLLAEK